MSKAPASGRSSGHVTLSFGLVSIPITLYSGTVSAHGVERHEYLTEITTHEASDPQAESAYQALDPANQPLLDRNGDAIFLEDRSTDHLIGRGLTNKTTGELLTVDEKALIQKKIETEYGPVFVEDHEIEQLFTLEPDTFKVKEFQPAALFATGQYTPKTKMFVEPTKSGSGAKKAYIPAALKLFGTLLKGMREEGVVAVGELTTRGVPKPAILTADGVLWLVWHTDATREQRELPEADLVDAEVQMLRQLVGAMTTTEVTDLSDARSELIQNFADEKAAAGDFGSPSADTYTPKPAEAAPDLMAMLAASVEQAKAS